MRYKCVTCNKGITYGEGQVYVTIMEGVSVFCNG